MKSLKYIVICVVMTIMMLSFATIAQAKTSYISDCLDENPDCLEELDTSDSNDQEDQQESNDFLKTDSESLLVSVMKMVFSLLLILALLYLFIKFFNKRRKLSNQGSSLENMGGLSVGPNKSIQIVRIGSQIYIIGVGENVELLKEITDEELKHDLLHRLKEKELGASSLIKSILPKKQHQGAKSENDSNKNFLNLFSQELEKLKQTRNKLKNDFNQKEDINE